MRVKITPVAIHPESDDDGWEILLTATIDGEDAARLFGALLYKELTLEIPVPEPIAALRGIKVTTKE